MTFDALNEMAYPELLDYCKSALEGLEEKEAVPYILHDFLAGLYGEGLLEIEEDKDLPTQIDLDTWESERESEELREVETETEV